MEHEYAVIAHGQDRAFEIMLGLREGYGNERHAPEHTVADVIAAHHDWQRTAGHVQGVGVTPIRLSYGWPGVAGEIVGADEPACLVTGNINVLYDASLTQDEARTRILFLADFLARRVGQSRVYVRFDGEVFILQAQGAVMPTGE